MQPTSILITGASSGIGAALAAAYARPGVVLHLGGRNRRRLSLVADRCRMLGATVDSRVQDVTDAAGMTDWINAADARAPLDLVIANAGIAAGGAAGVATEVGLAPEESSAITRRILAVNIDGVANTVLPALERMRARAPAGQGWRGQIAIMSSLAGLRGMPSAPAYSASRAAVKAWGEALSPRLRAEGILVSVLLPGFVDTPMTRRNPFPMPMMMSAERCATIIVRRLRRCAARVAFPFPMYLGAWFLAAVPPALVDPFLTALPVKSRY